MTQKELRNIDGNMMLIDREVTSKGGCQFCQRIRRPARGYISQQLAERGHRRTVRAKKEDR